MNNMLRTNIVVVLFIGLLAWAYQNLYPRASLICGLPGGPPVTGPRVVLRDGRHLAYSEYGVSRDIAKYNIIFVHGFSSCRFDASVYHPELFEELKIYMVTFDRPGSGESDPDPKRTIKSLALDMEDLADKLELGSKFYVIAYSMGQQGGWGSLKYIPHRLAGVALIAPVVNYWWSSFPTNLSMAAYKLQPLQDQWAVGVSHYTPWLVYWWNTQKWFPCSSVIAGKPNFSPSDWELFAKRRDEGSPMPVAKRKAYVRQQGLAESIFRDMRIGFGKWEFDPMEIENPFPNNEGSVHLWHGEDDRLVPVSLLRYMAKKLPWIHYHELPGVGHLLPNYDGKKESILKSLLLRNNDAYGG
nr:alpha/beta hydrolases superfamily protein [Tanacetum cinerariifolium]